MPFDANLNNADSDDDDDGNEKPGPRRPAKKDVGTKKGKLDGKSKTVTGGTKTKDKDVRKKGTSTNAKGK